MAKDKQHEEQNAQSQVDSEEHEDAESDPQDMLRKSKRDILIGSFILLLICGGAWVYLNGFMDPMLEAKKECVEKKDEHGEVIEACPDEEIIVEDAHGEVKKATVSNFVVMPTLLVNLNAEEEESRFLRLTVQLELENAADNEVVTAVMPRVVDQFQTYLRELRVKDLRGSAGIYRLQMELLWRVNQAAAPVKVKDVLFQEILIQ